uniref:Endonuclease V n=1 Tax=Astyanax mexicanus TaxID=7994 RepID=A0A8B9L3P5_ASTMX
MCRSSTKPVYVSVGHRISLATAVRLTLSCCRYRVPEPIRQVNTHTHAHTHFILLNNKGKIGCKKKQQQNVHKENNLKLPPACLAAVAKKLKFLI